MILEDICKAIEKINKKVDAIAQVIGPGQEIIKQALAQHVFDQDFIKGLLEASTSNLFNMEAKSYAKYVEGMTALGKKRNVEAAKEFDRALKQLQEIVPNDFLSDILRRHHEIEMWQKKADHAHDNLKKAVNNMNEQVAEFKEAAKKYKVDAKTEIGAISSEVRGWKNQAEVDIKKSVSEVNKELDNAKGSIVAKCKLIAEQGKAEIKDEISAIKQSLNIPEKIEKLREGLDDLTEQTHKEFIAEAEKVRCDFNVHAKLDQMRKEVDQFKDHADKYESSLRGAAKMASMAMQKSHMEIRQELESSTNKMRNESRNMVRDIHNQAVSAVNAAKVEMSGELDRAKSDLLRAVKDMEDQKEMLEELAKKAGQNIIETSRTIAKNSNSLPRSQRGRRNN